MKNVIQGTKFNYCIDTEYGINHDGFIAEGTESVVFKGIKYGSGVRYSCALKFKPKKRLDDFRNREYQILESMQICRSVVRILDVIEDLRDFSVSHEGEELNRSNCFCVVEEYIEGDSLQDYCIKQWFTYNTSAKKWERNTTEYSYREIVKFQNQIIQFMINLCEIMKFVSNVNEKNGKTDPNKPVILHCDIKPENIMVTRHGKELVLIDFGRSQQLMEGRTYQHYSDPVEKIFTADYSVKQWQDEKKDNLYAFGTVGYAAPECYALPVQGTFPFTAQQSALNHGCVSIESDIFGFGATFSECLSIYEICRDAFEKTPVPDNPNNPSNPGFFKCEIMEQAENNVRNGTIEKYCDRDFKGIDKAYHEALEKVLRKCTRTRREGFQDSEKTAKEYYHNFYQLQADIERARDSIPSLDRKSDPLVRQMLGVSGFCAAVAVCFLGLWIFFVLSANPLARNRWNTLKKDYTENQKNTALAKTAEYMMNVLGEKARQKNFKDILQFMYSGPPNDYAIDSDETELLLTLLRDKLSDQALWGEHLDTIIQHARSDNMDDIAKKVYRMNLSEQYESDGYILAKALTQVNDADDSDADKLKYAYDVLLIYSEDKKYSTIISKLAIKLMSGGKIETIASVLAIDRETIRDLLAPLTEIGGD